MSNALTVIITSHSDPDLYDTVRSIRATAGAEVDILVVDDFSTKPVWIIPEIPFPVYRTERRIGVGPARTLGALKAKTDFLLFVDAHCRFTNGWYHEAMAKIAFRPTTLHCGVCLGLDREHMDLFHPKGIYHGGTFNVLGKDRNDPGRTQILESIWNRGEIRDDSEIPCVLGASYFIARDYFLKLNPLAHLRTWGEDENMLSLKVWRSGGDVRLLTKVRIGHKFRLKGERVPYQIPQQDRVYNKAFAILTLIDQPLQGILLNRLRRESGHSLAWNMIQNNWSVIELERARNAALFTRGFDFVASKFNLALPTK